MISYEDAVRIVLENIVVPEPVERPVAECGGQVVADAIFARIDFPLSDISARDGYAVKSRDLRDASVNNPVTLRITETVRAGYIPRKSVLPGSCSRIMTGAHVPDGADCVVQFEDTDEPENKNGPNRNNPLRVNIHISPEPGAHIRHAGDSVMKGGLVLPAGTVIGPPQISALITAGCDRIRVIRRPVIAVIATGDELQNYAAPLKPGKIYNSNGPAIASMVAHYGGTPRILGIARDNESSLLAKLRRGMEADAIVTTGGVSMGDYDVVRLVLGKMGRVLFSHIKMGPGATVVFSLIERPTKEGASVPVPVFALAGPPSGSLINFETLVRPALLTMRGLKATNHPEVSAVAVDAFPPTRSMPLVQWTNLTGAPGAYRVEPSGKGAGKGLSMATSNSLTIIPEGSAIKAGDTVRVMPLSWSTGDFVS